MIFEFPAGNGDRQSRLARPWGFIRRRVGRLIRYFVEADAGMSHLNSANYVWHRRGPADRMSASEIENYQNDRYSVSCTRAEVPAVVNSIQGQVIAFISEILRKDPSVKSVLDIGAALAKVDSYLAAAFPGTEFIAVDLWADFEEINKDLLEPNLRLVKGYALDLIESDQVSADLVFTTSTATRMKNKELRRYLRTLFKTTRYIVLNEPLFEKPDGTIPDPNRIPLDTSEPTLIYPVYPGDKSGGLPPCLCHNYAALCQEAGYKVIYSRILHGSNPRIWLVAQKPSRDPFQ